MNSIKPKTALVSLSDKTNLEALVNFLVSQNVKILSTGGTYKAILKITEKVMEVSDFTGFEDDGWKSKNTSSKNSCRNTS